MKIKDVEAMLDSAARGIARGVVEELAPYIAELRAEVGLQPWHEDRDGSKWRDESRVSALERQVGKLFVRCARAEAKAAALASAFEVSFKPDLSPAGNGAKE